MYIELHSRSAFSFLEGASLPETLIAACANLGMPAMALLDRDGVYGSPRFHLAAKKPGIKAHIGAEVNLSPLFLNKGVSRTILFPNHQLQFEQCRARTPRLSVLAASRAGYQNLCRLITKMK